MNRAKVHSGGTWPAELLPQLEEACQWAGESLPSYTTDPEIVVAPQTIYDDEYCVCISYNYPSLVEPGDFDQVLGYIYGFMDALTQR
jgi:hypothetical protein